MQNHLPTSSLAINPASSFDSPRSPHSPANQHREPVVIDLLDDSMEGTAQDQNDPYLTPKTTRKMRKFEELTPVLNDTRIPQIKPVGIELIRSHFLMMPQDLKEWKFQSLFDEKGLKRLEIYDVDAPFKPESELQIMGEQSLASEKGSTKVQKWGWKGDSGVSSNKLSLSMTLDRPSFCEKYSANQSSDVQFPKRTTPFAFAQSIVIDDTDHQPPRRRTRSRARVVGSMYEGPEDIDLQDSEMRTRFDVAQYRYGLSGCRKAMRELAVKASRRASFERSIRSIPQEPIIPVGSYKHKIFVECLRRQLNRRRCIWIN